MKETEKFRNKKVAVVGFARSGLACANLLCGLGAKVNVTDCKDDASTRGNITNLKSKDIKVELGRHTREFIEGSDLLVISPGVPNSAAPLNWARELKIPAVSEIELAWILCPAWVVAVTGSNGKTTVTTLIGKAIEASGKKAFVCGNIGVPFSGEVDKIKECDLVSLEVSSFQLENIKEFKPKISVILNLSKNHLDRHRDMQEYLAAKKRIFMNQDENDFLVLNGQDPALKRLDKETKAKTVYFQSGSLNANQAAVMAVGKILGIEEELILKVFRDFRGLEHRMEFVAEVRKIKFINDSKATTAESAAWALNNITGPVILIAGGKHKGADYGILRDSGRKVKEMILIGEARQIIKESLKGAAKISEADSLPEAVRRAFSKACPGDSILLSPMCSSFDMFTDYEERGKVFKKEVALLLKENS